MRRSLIFASALLLSSAAHAQNITARVVATCGAAATGSSAGNAGFFTVDVNGVLCSSGSSGGGTQSVAPATAAGSGGIATTSRIPSSAASTNLTNAKASAGRVYKVYACNTTTSAKFVKFYNSTGATVGSTTILFSRALPPSSTAGVPLCQSFDQADIGWFFSTGISYALTGLNADADTTALAAGDVTQISVEFQ